MFRSRACMMMELDVPSMSRSLTGGMLYACRWWVRINVGSIKQSEDPESTRDLRMAFGSISEVMEMMSESGSERADALSVRGFAQGSLTQSSGRAGSRGLLNLFPSQNRMMRTGPDHSWPLMRLR